MKTTGSRCTPARFIASCHWPLAVEPSPKNVIATRGSRRSLNASAMPAGDQRHVGEHRDHPDAAEVRVAEVHVPVAPAGHAAAAAHVVGQVALRLDPADEVRAEVAVQDAHPVLGRERVGRADADRLLPAAVVEGARHLALLVEAQRPLLAEAHGQHVAEQSLAVLCRQRARRARWALRRPRHRWPFVGRLVAARGRVRNSLALIWSAFRVLPPGGISTPSGQLCSPLPVISGSAPTDCGAEGSSSSPM